MCLNTRWGGKMDLFCSCTRHHLLGARVPFSCLPPPSLLLFKIIGTWRLREKKGKNCLWRQEPNRAAQKMWTRQLLPFWLVDRIKMAPIRLLFVVSRSIFRDFEQAFFGHRVLEVTQLVIVFQPILHNFLDQVILKSNYRIWVIQRFTGLQTFNVAIKE